MFFLKEPKVIFTLIVFLFFKDLNVTDLKSNGIKK